MDRARTVLVVDDEPTVRNVVGQYLTRDGFRVVTTGDGREVSGLVQREPHGGTIRVADEPGGGARFTFTLPA